VNGKVQNVALTPGTYAEVKGLWKKGDRIELILPMEAKLIEANPLVEETRNQVTVKRGPVVYCLESVDVPKGNSIFNLSIPARERWTPSFIKIDNSNIVSLSGEAEVMNTTDWKDQLYKEVSQKATVKVPVKLVPYYAWGNRGQSEMSVWLPVSR
ncbi:MAG TPA: hypothetical protein VLJ41_02970, partial [Segetibacter sp.]|nr:hypothetical protein [Segetibacter sp.]